MNIKIKGRMRFKTPWFGGGDTYVCTGDIQVLLNEAAFRLKHQEDDSDCSKYAGYCVEQLLDAIIQAEANAR